MQAMATGRTIPARYELKYLVPEPVARSIARFARAYCVPDPHLANGEDAYTLTTLYLDSPDLRFHEDKKVLRRDRLKLRVRAYGPAAGGPVFLELKRRYGDVVSKTRTMVEASAWPALVREPTAFDRGAWGGRKPEVVEDFCLQCARYHARPIVAVRYDREPLQGRLDRDVRVTFDRGIRFCRVAEPVVPAPDDLYLPLRFGTGQGLCGGWVVLELKFTWSFPRWMQELVEHFDLDRGSFSKYGRALEQALGELRDHDPAGIRSPME